MATTLEANARIGVRFGNPLFLAQPAIVKLLAASSISLLQYYSAHTISQFVSILVPYYNPLGSWTADTKIPTTYFDTRSDLTIVVTPHSYCLIQTLIGSTTSMITVQTHALLLEKKKATCCLSLC